MESENQKKRKQKSEEEYVETYCKDIPDDLVPAILCKLPARSICRFRCVCKSWRDLFGDEEFINRTRAKPPFEFEIQRDRAVEYYTIDETGFMITKGEKQFIGGCKYRRCKNTICCQTDTHIFCVFDLSKPAYLLPDLPSSTSFNFEFGFDPCSNHFKVLVWTDGSSTRPMTDFYILDLEGNCSSWRRPWGSHISNFHSCEKSIATTTGMFYLVDDTTHHLISFNLSTERFRIIQLPHEVFQRRKMNQSDHWYQLFEYQECLCWVEQSVIRNIDWEITGMWMLKDHVDIQWVRLMKEITLPFLMPMPIEASSASTTWSQKHSQFSSTRSGEIMITISGTEFGEDPSIVLYSFLDCKFRTIEISIDSDDDCCGLDNNESFREL